MTISISRHELAYGAIGLAVVLALVALIIFLITRRKKRGIEERWKENQKLLANKKTWQDAIIGADKLLDEVLRKRHFKGKTTGERLVAAQHELSMNDAVWFGHKLKNRIVDNKESVTKAEVKKALLGFWQAMKDLGEFKKNDEKR